MPDMTMREAVEYLSKEEGNYQLWGASYIQHSTFKEAKPKQEVRLTKSQTLWCWAFLFAFLFAYSCFRVSYSVGNQ